MTTFYTATASSAAELAEALLLTSSACESTSSSSSSLSVSTSVEDEDMMMLDFDVDDSPLPSCLVNCMAFTDDQAGRYPFDKRPLDLIQGDSQAVTSAVFCFVKKFVCASGSSTVAIDNKIEQAMDLVKSHLMFAVREEVEVLKERIDVLMERIAFLESENQILKSAATQETLAQIAQLEATFPVSGNDNIGSGGSVSVVGVASSVGPIVNNTVTSTTTTPSTTTSCTSSHLPSGTSPAP